MQKNILNFYQISSHSTEIIEKIIEKCLTNWGIHSVFSITVDNASLNDLGVRYFNSWNSLLLRGELLHVKCCVHILSLIVTKVLKDINDSIARIYSAVSYVRSSPSKLRKFKSFVELENIESKSLVYLDVDSLELNIHDVGIGFKV